MKRENLTQNIKNIKAKIAELRKAKFKYFIHGKYIPSFGMVQNIEKTEDLINAFAFVKSQFNYISGDSTDAANSIADELGLTKSKKDQEDEEEETYLGFTYEEWKEEFTMKGKEIKNESDIKKLEKALEKFKSYRSEEDCYNEDVNKYSDLFDELGLSEK